MADVAYNRFDGPDPYWRLRSVLDPKFASLPPEQLGRLFSGLFAEVDPEDLESLLDDLSSAFSLVAKTASNVAQGATKAVGQAAQTAAPFVVKSLPGLVQGATTGLSVGGPIGAVVGGLGGGALSAATGGKGLGGSNSPLGAIAGALGGGSPLGVITGALGGAGGGSPVAGILGQVLGGVGGGKPAISSLVNLLSQPSTGQALTSMLLGKAGVTQIPVAGSAFPTGLFASLLSQLASQAAAEYDETVAADLGGIPSYLIREDGEFAVDIGDPVQRAGLLLREIEAQTFALPEADPEVDLEAEPEGDYETLDEYYDALELEELAEADD